MTQFEHSSDESTQSLIYAPWLEQGLLHGFCGSSLCPSLDDFESSCRKLQEVHSLSSLIIPKQEHTSSFELFSVEELESQEVPVRTQNAADAVILQTSTGSSKRAAIAVMSADCVPILIAGKSYIAAIHAGWRGLASNIISVIINQLHFLGEQDLFAVIGPCAGGASYEVGMEVVDQIGDAAVFDERGAKALLSLEETAVCQLLAADPKIKHVSSGICTISDKRFSSYRRSGNKRGVNISFLCVPSDL